MTSPSSLDLLEAVLGKAPASHERIQRTIDALRGFGVERIGIGHCTGERATRRLSDAFGERCFWLSVGTRVARGP